MRTREAAVIDGERYRLPSMHCVQVDAIVQGAYAACRYVRPDGSEPPPLSQRGQVVLTLRFIEKHARRVWR
jgi:hypothetical protein